MMGEVVKFNFFSKEVYNVWISSLVRRVVQLPSHCSTGGTEVRTAQASLVARSFCTRITFSNQVQSPTSGCVSTTEAKPRRAQGFALFLLSARRIVQGTLPAQALEHVRTAPEPAALMGEEGCLDVIPPVF